MYHSGAVVQGHWQKWGSMAEPSTDEKTSERLFWFQPESLGQPLVKTSGTGTIDHYGVGSNGRVAVFKRSVEGKLQAIAHGIPAAIRRRDCARREILVFAGVRWNWSYPLFRRKRRAKTKSDDPGNHAACRILSAGTQQTFDKDGLSRLHGNHGGHGLRKAGNQQSSDAYAWV